MLETISLARKAGSRKTHDAVVAACCQACTVGCGLLAYIKDDRIVDIQGDPDHPANRGRLCARGITFVNDLTVSERITLPGTRNRLSGPFEAMDNWEKGIDLLAERLRRVKEQHGAASLVIGCDPEAGLDFYLGARRFARLFGTPHVIHPHQEGEDEALPTTLRHPTAESSRWQDSRCLLLVEADLATTHPVLFQRVLEARDRGATLIAVDARFTATLAKADIAVQIDPNQGNILGLALMQTLITQQAIDPTAADAAWADAWTGLSTDDLVAAAGVEQTRIETLARALTRHRPAVVITGKRLAAAPHYAIWHTMAQAMGWQGRPGGGWYPLESGTPVLDPEAGLDAPLPENDAPVEMKALIGSGNCLSSFLSPMATAASDADLNVFFGSIPNRTRKAAHMVFPAALWPERNGIVFTDDGAVQWSPQIVRPGDACRSGLGFWLRLARRFGWEDHFPWVKANGLADHAAFYDWLFANSVATTELQLEPVRSGDARPVWHAETATAPAAVPLYPAPAAIDVPAAAGDPVDFPLIFQSTRNPVQDDADGQDRLWARELSMETGIQIHPRTARALAVENGDTVVVASADEAIQGAVAISRMVTPRMVWSPERMRATRVLVYRKGQAPDEARQQLKAMEP